MSDDYGDDRGKMLWRKEGPDEAPQVPPMKHTNIVGPNPGSQTPEEIEARAKAIRDRWDEGGSEGYLEGSFVEEPERKIFDEIGQGPPLHVMAETWERQRPAISVFPEREMEQRLNARIDEIQEQARDWESEMYVRIAIAMAAFGIGFLLAIWVN